jgi:hypothetical protein
MPSKALNVVWAMSCRCRCSEDPVSGPIDRSALGQFRLGSEESRVKNGSLQTFMLGAANDRSEPNVCFVIFAARGRCTKIAAVA